MSPVKHSGSTTNDDRIHAHWWRARQRFVKFHIILRTIVTIASIILMPLMAWHQASSHLVDALGMPHIWVEDVQKGQDHFVKTWLWVFLWVLVSADFWHALYCLGDDQTRGTLSPKDDERIWRLCGPLMLFLFDMLLSLIAALYILDFVATIHANMALCNASKTKDIPTWSLQLAHQREQEEAGIPTEKFITLSAQERCLRLTGTILIAGGFACGVAAILATLHLASILCRFSEASYMWILRHKSTSNTAKYIEPRATDPNWRNPPRDIDIHTRTTREGGLLTGISEEEQNTGGVLRRRRQANATQSNASAKSKTSSALEKIEDILLECLVP